MQVLEMYQRDYWVSSVETRRCLESFSWRSNQQGLQLLLFFFILQLDKLTAMQIILVLRHADEFCWLEVQSTSFSLLWKKPVLDLLSKFMSPFPIASVFVLFGFAFEPVGTILFVP